jgi:hypothetical protein
MSVDPFSGLTGANLLSELRRSGPPAWPARVQEFRAGGIGVDAVLVLRPYGEDGSADEVARDRGPFGPGLGGGNPTAAPGLLPLVVVLLGEPAYRVAPGLRELVPGRPGPGDRGRGRSGDAVSFWGVWSVLDGPEPLVKLTVTALPPARLRADLVFSAEAAADVLRFAAVSSGIGLMPEDCAHALPAGGSLRDALDVIVPVPTRPSTELLSLLEGHGWLDR